MSSSAGDVLVAPAIADAVKPPPGNPRFPSFDGLRAIAVLAVLGSHVAGQTPSLAGKWWGPFALRLDIGVAVFFVISGFLLYRPFVAARFGLAPRPRVAAYARRRVLRIVPAYWLALSLLAIYPGLTGFSSHWWAFYGFLQIYSPNFTAFFQGLPQAWSLCVEVTFYAALPILAALLLRSPTGTVRRRFATEWLAVGAMVLGSIAFRFVLHERAPQSVLIQTLPGLLVWFAAGMGLAVASVAYGSGDAGPRIVRACARRPLVPWLAGGALFVVAAEAGKSVLTLSANSSLGALGEYVLYGVVSMLLVVPAVFAQDRISPPKRILDSRVAQWLGLISYGIFLWHVTILTKLADWGVSGFVALFLSCLAVSVVFASLSYYLVERPILRFKESRRRPTGGAPAGATA